MTNRSFAKQEFVEDVVTGAVAQPVNQLSIFNKCKTYTRAKDAMKAGVYPYFHKVESAQEPDVVCDGRPMIMMSSNDYLGLTSHPRVKQAAIDAVNRTVRDVLVRAS